MYYIISLHHTHKWDEFITLWRPKNAVYCYSKELAGLYEIPKPGYHDSNTDMPISEENAQNLFIEVPYEGILKYMIPNCSPIWKVLGVKMTKNGLQKLPVKK